MSNVFYSVNNYVCIIINIVYLFINVHSYLKEKGKAIKKVEPTSKIIKPRKYITTSLIYLQKRYYSTKEKNKLDNFTFLILDLFPEIVNKENNKKLLDLEDFYLKTLLPNYNILTEAGNSFGYKHTEVSRIKMRLIYNEKRKNTIYGLNNNNKPLTNEVKEKLNKKGLLKSPRVFTEGSLLNTKKNSKPIVIYNKDGTVYGEY